MKQITQLSNRLVKETDFSRRYPEYKPDDGKIHVLYLASYLSGQGLYRQILPALHLNQTETHCAIVNALMPFDQDNRIKENEITINDKLIWWADYIVFPSWFYDISKDVEMLTKASQRKYPDKKLQFVMDADDILEYTLMHPMHKQVTNKMKDQVLANMNRMDLITGTNIRLLDYYNNLLTQKYPDKKHDLFMLPNLVSDFCYEDTKVSKESKKQGKKDDKIRIGLTLNNTQFSDINPLNKILQKINSRYKDKVELIVFGWDGRIPGTFKNALKDVRFIHIPSVQVLDYFKTLYELQLDIALMPLQDTPFNLSKSHHKLLQYSYYGIPAIVSNIPTYTDVINNKEPLLEGKETFSRRIKIDAMVVQKKADWLDMIDELISNKKKREQMARHSAEAVQMYYKYEDNIRLWQECFR